MAWLSGTNGRGLGQQQSGGGTGACFVQVLANCRDLGVSISRDGFVFSTTYDWSVYRVLWAELDVISLGSQMLRITRKANGEVVFRVSGQLARENVAEMETLIAAETKGRRIVLDCTDSEVGRWRGR